MHVNITYISFGTLKLASASLMSNIWRRIKIFERKFEGNGLLSIMSTDRSKRANYWRFEYMNGQCDWRAVLFSSVVWRHFLIEFPRKKCCLHTNIIILLHNFKETVIQIICLFIANWKWGQKIPKGLGTEIFMEKFCNLQGFELQVTDPHRLNCI